ncbi:SLBB domain-containing protein [Thiothrix eikelboomii]|uniref:Protein involved in polysaccharide export, contains SLBB domain of the beta-grasp fold n=1 Tax=Thiothrix eikelboomii TaxID=92487 RepID=A0A1T4W7A5_9GAMM|nr:SLBB domain-containing protein [Thiothrix eikelboomii]SKA72591.1 protein involved in polysaccharide export, contains SLBB domain of the beta-grasp fold [Thiothrix eikelboomii]
MHRPAQNLSLLSACLVLSACAAKTPNYPAPPLFAATVTAYNPSVIPLAPITRPVPVAPIVLPKASQVAGSDLIGEQDLLDITVFKVPDLTRSVRVDGQGYITYPLVGKLRAKGLRPAQLEQQLASLLEKTYMHNPQVTVLVKESTQNRVTVEGAVRLPGVFPVVGSMTVLQALAKAGGLTEQADSRRAILLRKDAKGELSQQPIDIAAIRQGRLQDFILLQDDRLVVQDAIYNRFTVSGAVGQPGVYPLKEGMTVMQAVATAGGMTRLANKYKALVFRRGLDGREQHYAVNLDAIYRGTSLDPMIQQDDRIVILEAREKVIYDEATRFLSPVTLF